MDNDPTTLLTELARRGDLHSLLSKVGRYAFRDRRGRLPRSRERNRYILEDEDELIPVVVVWQIFDCCESWPPSFNPPFCSCLFLSVVSFGPFPLDGSPTQVFLVVTACMSMAYPPRQQAPPNQGSMHGEFGPLLPEVIPAPGAHVNHHDLVHFDIDPQNVFIYDPDNAHRGVPIFKVGFCVPVLLPHACSSSMLHHCHFHRWVGESGGVPKTAARLRNISRLIE